MNLFSNLLDRPTAEAFGWMLVHSLWELVLIAGAAAALLSMLRRHAPGTRYLAACAALLMMVVAPVATCIVLLPRWVPMQTLPPAPLDPARARSAVAPNPPPAIAPPQSLTERSRAAIRASLPAAETLYLLGLFLCSLRLAVGYARLRALVHRAHPIHGHSRSLFVDLSARLGVRRAVRLLESALVEVPTVAGILRPTILLPVAGLTGLSPQQLEAILAHELAHIRRHDHLIIHLQTLIETLLFYHPAVWWLSSRVRQERENACDDIAVRLTGNAVDYARALASLEHLRAAPRRMPPHLVAAARSGVLLPRIRRLLGTAPAPARPAGQAVSGLVILAALAAVLYAFGCAQRQGPVVAGNPNDGKGQILMKFWIANMDESYLAQQGVNPATLPGASSGTALLAVSPVEIKDAIKNHQHGELVSRPSILAADGQEAMMQIGQNVAGPDGKPAFAGVQLDVVPHLQPDGKSVSIDMKFSVSALVPDATPRPPGATGPVPVVESREMEAMLTLANDDTAMLFGQALPDAKAPPGPPRQMVILVEATWKLTPEYLKQLQHAALTRPAAAATAVVEYRQLINTNAVEAADLVNAKFAAPNGTPPANRLAASSDTRTNTVVLTGPANQVRQALDMLNKMDNVAVNPSGTTVFFIAHLKSAKAQQLAATLNALYGAKPNAMRPADTGAGNTYVVANPDTNSLLVTTDRLYEERVRAQIAALDVAAPAPVTQPSTKSATQPAATAAQPAGAAGPVFKDADPDHIPVTDDRRTQIIPLKNLKASDLADELRTFASSDAVISADPDANAIVITETSAVIHRVAEIIQQVDKKKPATVVEYRQLINNNGADVAQLINATFHPGNAGDPTPQSVYADSDSRTNTVVISGPPEQVRQALDTIDKLEAVAWAAGDAAGEPTRDLVLRGRPEQIPIGNRDAEAQLRREVLDRRRAAAASEPATLPAAR